MIAGSVAKAKKDWLEYHEPKQLPLFDDGRDRWDQLPLRLDVSGITDEQFWEQAEDGIYSALQAYAETADRSGGYQRRLFADDTAEGFSFIDVCRHRYDAILMNPPFGEVALGLESICTARYRSRRETCLPRS